MSTLAEPPDTEPLNVVVMPMSAWTVLPPAAHLCQTCGHDHDVDQPHNKQTLHYGAKFRIEHGREPTWADAMAHCDQRTQELWKRELARMGVPPEQLEPVKTTVAVTRMR